MRFRVKNGCVGLTIGPAVCLGPSPPGPRHATRRPLLVELNKDARGRPDAPGQRISPFRTLFLVLLRSTAAKEGAKSSHPLLCKILS